MDKSAEFKWAVRVVVKRQLRDLLQQLHDRGDEIAVMAVNVQDGTCSHFGTSHGEWFMSEQRELLPRFLKYCQSLNKEDGDERAEFKEVDSDLNLKSSARTRAARSLKQEDGAAMSPKRAAEKSVEKADGADVERTPVMRSRRSGRTISAKYMEGIASLKKKSRTPAVEDKHIDDEEVDIGQMASIEAELEPGETEMGVEVPDVSDDEDMFHDTHMDDGDESDDFDDPDMTLEKELGMPQVKRVRTDITPVAGRPATAAESKKYTEALEKKMKSEKPKKTKYASVKDKMKVKCDECGQIIVGYWNLGSHKRRIHQKVRNASCQVCDKTFWSNHDRETHTASIHTRKCDTCGEYVVESAHWPEGIDRRTPRDVLCSCGAVVSIYSRYGRVPQPGPGPDGKPRRKKVRRATPPKYACGHCGKLFNKRSNCELHSRMHSDLKPHVCEICGQQYVQESGLSYHMVNTHGIVGEVCNVCGKNFTTRKNLITHTNKYHGENGTMIVDGGIKVEDGQMKGDGEMDIETETGITVVAAEMNVEAGINVEGALNVEEGQLHVTEVDAAQITEAGAILTEITAEDVVAGGGELMAVMQEHGKDAGGEKQTSWLVTTDKGIIIQIAAEGNIKT